MKNFLRLRFSMNNEVDWCWCIEIPYCRSLGVYTFLPSFISFSLSFSNIHTFWVVINSLGNNILCFMLLTMKNCFSKLVYLVCAFFSACLLMYYISASIAALGQSLAPDEWKRFLANSQKCRMEIVFLCGNKTTTKV